MKIYEIGGSIRDELLGRPTKDRDYAVEGASFRQLNKFLQQSGFKIFLSRPDMGTIRGLSPEGTPCDFTLCLKADPKIGIKPGTIDEDLARRDFTVNAMARDLDGARIIDPFNAYKDLKKKVIRCPLSPKESFKSDGVRILRAIRLKIQLQFALDPSILKALKSNEFASAMRQVSDERLRAELQKSFHLSTMETWDSLKAIHPDYQRILFDEMKIELLPRLVKKS